MVEVEETAVIDRPIDEVWSLLRDFNGHDRWHPAIRTSHMQGGVAHDKIGGVRDFRLTSGERICEQLLYLSDTDRSFSYTITEADMPLFDYVAHVQLRPVTAEGRTFWRWWSSFRTPPGREEEFRTLVADGVYRAGFQGARAYFGKVVPDAETVIKSTTAPAYDALEGDAIIVSRHGGPEVLETARVTAPSPTRGKVRLQQEAIGVNYIDVYCRTGYFDLIRPPAIPGMEAAGIVHDVGPGVTHLSRGDRVTYACAPPGAYAGIRTMPADLVVPLPDDVDSPTAAALTLKGITAYFLLHKVHPLQQGETALVYAPAGGVGRLLVQWATALGAVVIGATSSPEKAEKARAAGAKHMVMPGAKSLEDQLRDLTGGRGVDVVFDAVGKDSFDHSVAALRPCGHLVSYGQASGDIGDRNIGAFAATSLKLSRPNFGHYTDTRAKVIEALDAVWQARSKEIITADIGQTFPLSRAGDAHRALESRRTMGSTLLIPEA
jgi:NADPH:quinone reductase-like Zn-dependent oxidoreductase